MRWNWNNITVGKYSQIYQVLKNEDIEPIVDKQILILCTLTGKSKSYIENIPLDQFRKMSAQIEFIDNLAEVNTEFPNWIYFKGKLYKPYKNLSKLKAGQFVDLSNFCRDKERLVENIANCLGVVCQPLRLGLFRRMYSGELQQKTAKEMEELPMSIAYPIALFFCLVWQNSQEPIRQSLASLPSREMRKILKLQSLLRSRRNPLKPTTAG